MRKFPPINNQPFIDALQANSEAAIVELYGLFRTFTPSAYRYLDEDQASDVLHDAFISVLRNIQDGQLKDPGNLFAYCRQVIRNTAYLTVRSVIQSRQDVHLDHYPEIPPTVTQFLGSPPVSPETEILGREQGRLLNEVLGTINERDREILVSFYVSGDGPAEIRTRLKLSDKQYRLFKSRAKDRVQAVLKAYVEHGQLPLRSDVPRLVKAHVKGKVKMRRWRAVPLKEIKAGLEKTHD